MYKNLKNPEVYLAYKDKRTICSLNVYKLNCDPRLPSVSSGSFRIYRYENDKEVPYWEKIQLGLLVEIRYLSWFVISRISLDKTENGEEYMDIEFQSLEVETGQTLLTSFGSLGTDLDKQGGLDRYCLYNIFDQEHSIMHIFKQKNAGWKIGDIDPDISTQYRAFDVDSISSYDFLVDKVAKVYECVFIFDTYKRSVNAYKLENIGKKTEIFLSDRNLIKSANVKSDDSDIKTMFNVSGGNDSRTNTPLSIIDVNPSGSSSITDFTYYYSQMSKELVDKLNEYNELLEQNEPLYSSALLVLEDLYVELETLNHNVPENHDTTDLTQFGLAELQEKEKTYWNIMSIYTNDSENKEYVYAYNSRKEVLDELGTRKMQIKNKENEISLQLEIVKSYIVNIQEVLGDDLYAELSYFIREQDFQDDSFVATTEMTQDEIYEMQKELISHARNELSRISHPQFEMTIDVVNFIGIEDFEKFTKQLELGNIITVEWDTGVLIEARILGFNFDFDNPDNFEIIISNKTSLNDAWALRDILKQTESTSTSVDYNSGAWNVAKQTSLDFKNWVNQIYDASLQNLQNSDNQEVLMDGTGILVRKWLIDQNEYSPNQLWLTNGQIAFTRDDWQSVCTAIGEVTLPDGHTVYGIVGEYIVGEIFAGEQLILRGSCANLDFETNNDFKNAQVAIKANSDGISLKVSKDDVINAINLSPESTHIQGNKIQLDGEVTFSNTNKFTLESETTVIDGGCIRTNTIEAQSIKSDTAEVKQAWVEILESFNITTKKINCGNGYLVADDNGVSMANGYLTVDDDGICLGSLKVYDDNGNTYLAYYRDEDLFGIGDGDGAHFWSNWYYDGAYGTHGSAAFQVTNDGALYVSDICVHRIQARYGYGGRDATLYFAGDIDFSDANVTGLPSSSGVSSETLADGLTALAEIVDNHWNDYTSGDIQNDMMSWISSNL